MKDALLTIFGVLLGALGAIFGMWASLIWYFHFRKPSNKGMFG